MNQEARGRLIAAARSAKERAYAPYSGFRVGAALLARDGSIFVGCNVENASYPVSLCAERSALAAAVCAGARAFEAVAIMANSVDPCPPCGMCRQALVEFAGEDLLVVLVAADGSMSEFRLGDLLPEAFRPGLLEVEPQRHGT